MRNVTSKTILYAAMTLASVLLIGCACSCAQNSPGDPNCQIDTSPFQNSAHHWYDIYDKSNVINAAPNQPRYNPSRVTEIADNILLYQKDNGGWPKNYDMRAILTPEEKNILIKDKTNTDTTFDNTTTYSHIEYLAKAYQCFGNEKYKDAALKGIDFTLSAQYPNGGWPQFFPLRKNYSRLITFNDSAMTGVMDMLASLLNNKPWYSFVDADRRQKAKVAFDKGLDCILKCQIKDDGVLTAWCQQHDENTLAPAEARAYELPSICNRESTGIVLFLMSLDNPSPQVINAVQSAIKWFDDSKITGIRVEEFQTPPFQTPLRVLTTDKKVVQDPNAPPIWARFYELKTHRPLFSNRQSARLYSLADVNRERRAYGWYTYEPQQALDEYPAWQKKVAPENNVLKK
jgi:PelA/Pel-15E family pectate lyase